MVLLFKELHLEGQDAKQLIDVALDPLDAVLLPSPDLRSNIVIDRTDMVGMHVLRDVKIEARVVNKDDHIGFPFADVALGIAHVLQDGGQVHQHRNEAHVSQLTVVLDTRTANLGHEVTAIETELCLRVFTLERLHQSRCVKVATGLTSYQIVFHVER